MLTFPHPPPFVYNLHLYYDVTNQRLLIERIEETQLESLAINKDNSFRTDPRGFSSGLCRGDNFFLTRFRVSSSGQEILSIALADSCRRVGSRQTQRGDSETSPRDTVVVSSRIVCVRAGCTVFIILDEDAAR